MRFLDYYPCKECNGTGKKLLLGRQVVDCNCCNGFKKHFPNITQIESAHHGWPLCDECNRFYAPPTSETKLCLHCERIRQRVTKARIMERVF